MKNLLLCITLLCLLVAGTIPANGKTFRTESRITQVSAHSISVNVGHAKHTYKITGETAIRLDGRKASARELRKGMAAEVTASQINPKIAIEIEAQHRG